MAIWHLSPWMGGVFTTSEKQFTQGAYRTDKALNIIIERGITVAGIEDAVRKAVPIWLPTFGLTRIAAVLAVFGVGLVVLAGFSVFTIFQDLISKYAFGERDIILNNPWLAGISLVVSAALLGFLPQALSGSSNSPLRRLLKQWVDDDGRRQQRLTSRLRWAKRLGFVKTIKVWNAAGSMQGAKGFLLKALEDSNIPVDFHVHADELSLFRTRARTITKKSLTLLQTPKVLNANTGDPIALMEVMLGGQYADAMAYILAFTTLRAKPSWTLDQDNQALEGSDVLIPNVWEMTRRSFIGEEGDHPITMDLFLTRLEQDYALLSIDQNQHVYTLNAQFDWHGSAKTHALRLQTINSHLPLAAMSNHAAMDDPMALYILMIGVEAEQWNKPFFADMFSNYAHACKEQGYFPGLRCIAEMVRDDIAAEDNLTAEPASHESLLAGMSVDGLISMAENFEAIGDYDVALAIAQRVAAFEGPANAVRIARLHERLNNHEVGLAALEPVKTTLRRIEDRIVDISAGANINTPSEGEVRFALGYSLQRAWIILSAALDLPGARLSDAASHLRLADQIFTGLPDFTPLPMDVWRLSNYWATYYELMGDYDAAIDRHRAAAKIPGTPLRWRYGSLINAGLVLRQTAVREWLEDGATDLLLIKGKLQNALSYALQGYEGKFAIDDKDEAPLGAHNAALIYMYLTQIDSREGHQGKGSAHIQAAMVLVETALFFQAETGSAKKRHIILSEGVLLQEWAATRQTKLAPTPYFDRMKSELDPAQLAATDQDIIATMQRLEATL